MVQFDYLSKMHVNVLTKLQLLLSTMDYYYYTSPTNLVYPQYVTIWTCCVNSIVLLSLQSHTPYPVVISSKGPQITVTKLTHTICEPCCSTHALPTRTVCSQYQLCIRECGWQDTWLIHWQLLIWQFCEYRGDTMHYISFFKPLYFTQIILRNA